MTKTQISEAQEIAHDRLRRARNRLELEQIHYDNTRRGRQFLDAAYQEHRCAEQDVSEALSWTEVVA